jgi:hypothetical protein
MVLPPGEVFDQEVCGCIFFDDDGRMRVVRGQLRGREQARGVDLMTLGQGLHMLLRQ